MLLLLLTFRLIGLELAKERSKVVTAVETFSTAKFL